MKVTLYMDVEPWMDRTWNFQACAKPYQPKGEGKIRYAFTIEIPDPEMADVDLGETPVEIVGEKETA